MTKRNDMNASDRFKPVLKVAENRESNAARKFGLSQKQQHEEEEKLQSLRQYHSEYMSRFQQTASIGMSASQLREYQAFLNKLETAIVEQEEIVRQSQQNCTAHKKQWTKKHIRTQTMDKAMGRMVKSEQKQKDAQDQKMSDEIAQRIIRSTH
jgi:flagellar FliJ protein